MWNITDSERQKSVWPYRYKNTNCIYENRYRKACKSASLEAFPYEGKVARRQPWRMRWGTSVYAAQSTSSVALRRQLPLIGEASGVSGKLHKGRCAAANLQVRHSIFFCFSKRKRWQKKKSLRGFRFPLRLPWTDQENRFGFLGSFPR